MTVTQRLLELDSGLELRVLNAITGEKALHQKDWYDLRFPAGISEIEGEFLYGLTRLLSPRCVLETGTNAGISTRYIALALADNGHGSITTIEWDGGWYRRTRDKLVVCGFDNVVCLNTDVGKFDLGTTVWDMVVLDTEPATRYAELIRFFPNVAPGGIICIHDLWELDFSMFGGVPPTMRSWMKQGVLRAMTFQTSHGISAFQKSRDRDYIVTIMGEP